MTYQPTREQLEMLGNDVIVTGPNAEWRGRAIAIAPDPSIVIEDHTGFRVTLPLGWARLAATPDLVELDPLAEYAAAEKRLSQHLAGWLECDLGNENCEHVQRRNAAYLAYTKRPHPSTLRGGTVTPRGFFRCTCGKMHMISPHVTPMSRCTCGRPLLGRMLDAAG
jgi:hypothetical protein